MKIARLFVVGSAFALAGQSMAVACDPPQRIVRVSQVQVVRGSCEVPALEVLVKLQQPVHVRVVQCVDELEQAEAAVAEATCQLSVAREAADTAMRRVESVACVLRTMCRTVEICGTVYCREDVAGALEVLIGRYHSAAAAVTAAEELLGVRQASLQRVAEKVARWQQKERDLLTQVAALRAAHGATKAQTLTESAEKLAADISGMLKSAGKPEVKIEETTTTEETTVITTESAPEPSQTGRLLEEVDQILGSEGSAVVR
ncbi:MAG: hypothetical protein RLZZ458_949 [Planctomycetota bacterium]|jgi:hypothetical protein